MATKVKIENLKHNSTLNRFNKITDEDYKRIEKYKKALNILSNKQ